MHTMLSDAAKARMPLREFARSYRAAEATLTQSSVDVGDPGAEHDGVVELPVQVRTELFGTLSGTLTLPVDERGDGEVRVGWQPHHVFPGLARGEALERETMLPTRGTIEARDGTPLAEGALRSSAVPDLAISIVGTIGLAPPEQAAVLAERGLPAESTVGLTGLEREFDARLAGRPGGVLRAGDRVIASATPLPGETVRTTIDLEVQQAAVDALAGRLGGVAAIRPETGEVVALAGIAASAPQPPGSTFKIVTLAGALDARVTRPSERFPVVTAATLEGVELENANGEACGGTLEESFAESCNSVFGPLGAELGAGRLVKAAERFGFNQPPALAMAAGSTLPQAGEIGDDLAVGSTAIGQGRVLATTLDMAAVAAAIADGGVRRSPTLLRGHRTTARRATSVRTARIVRRFMRAVVESGTGIAAAIPGVAVAGKTGTAELRTTQPKEPPDPTTPSLETVADETDTDAWFVAFAPAAEPRIAVAVLLVGHGAGGTTAAPAARGVLEAGLRSER
jgi:cell division protein FtsI/penicillin-binding protein 2